MRRHLNALVQHSVARTLRGVEARLSRDRHKLGGIQRLLERTWFDPSVRPVAIDTVEARLRQLACTRVGVIVSGSAGDANVTALMGRVPDRTWSVLTFNRTVTQWAGHPVQDVTPQAVTPLEALVVLDPDPAEYLNVLRFCHEQGVSRPVLTDFTRLPWAGGQSPLFAGELETMIYLHHHFGEAFGIKDPLQVLYEVSDGPEVKAQGFWLLGPNQTLRVSMRALGVGPLRHGVFRHIAYHPAFAKLPHRRFRTSVDIQNAWSQCAHHGIELERELPNYAKAGGGVERKVLHLGPGRDTWLTVMRSGFSSASSGQEPLHVSLTATVQGTPVTTPTLTVSPVQRSVTVSVNDLFGHSWTEDHEIQAIVSIQGPCDRLCWTAVERQASGRINLTGNHGFQGSHKVLDLMTRPRASETLNANRIRALADLATMRANQLLMFPFAVPVFSGEQELETAFHFAHTLPPMEWFEVAAFDADGRLVSRQPQRLRFEVPAFVDPRTFLPEEARARGGLLLVAPFFEQEGVRPEQAKVVACIRFTDVRSGDHDYTELQDSWRNIQGYVPRYPSNTFSGRTGVTKNRTSLMMRVAHDGDSASHLCLVLASGDLRFHRRAAPVELRYLRPDGSSLIRQLTIDAWTARYLRLEELFPELPTFSPEGYGWLRITANQVDLNALSINRLRHVHSVAIQHLWGQ